MKVQIITNLYPLPWEPNRAAFNRQQFQQLSLICPLRITVLISWLERLKHRDVKLKPVNSGNLQVNYRSYFYIPGWGRFTHAATLLLSLLLEKKHIERFQPDCLLMSWAYPDGVAGVLLAKLLRLPAVIKIHGSDINMHLLHGSRARQILWAMKHAQRVVSVSKALAAKLIDSEIRADKIKVIYNGVNKDIFKLNPDHEFRDQFGSAGNRKVILYIGNLKQEKGCVDLIEAFARISQLHEELDLYYIGAGREADTILARAKEEGLQSRVVLLGSLSHEKLAAWMNAATIVSLPSYNEGVPNVLLEAMACGTPVVATKVGGIPEVVQQQAGILVESGDVAALANALDEAMSTNWNAHEIIDSVDQFDWEKNVSQLYESLEDAVSMHKQLLEK